MEKLITESAALALDLLEKNGVLTPFCKIRGHDAGIVFITADCEPHDFGRAYDSNRAELLRRIAQGEVAAFAFCADTFTKLSNLPDEQRFLRIEFQDGTLDSGIYYFTLFVRDGRASVGRYYGTDLARKEL